MEAILDVAARAPSGTNMQPGAATCWPGRPRTRWCDAVQAAFDAQEPGHCQEVPVLSRRVLRTLPVAAPRRWAGSCTGCWASRKGEAAKMRAQHRRNFQFFDAPVGHDLHHRPAPRDRVLAGLRHVPAERHDRRARPRPGHLRPGGLDALPPRDPPRARSGRRGDRGLRHGAGPRRSGRAGEYAGDRARAGPKRSCGSTGSTASSDVILPSPCVMAVLGTATHVLCTQANSSVTRAGHYSLPSRWTRPSLACSLPKGALPLRPHPRNDRPVVAPTLPCFRCGSVPP